MVAPGVLWLTHKGREVLPSGLKTDAGASGKKRGGGGAWVRWLTHIGRKVSPSGLKTRCWRIGNEERWCGARGRWLTLTGREVSPSGLKTDAGFGGLSLPGLWPNYIVD